MIKKLIKYIIKLILISFPVLVVVRIDMVELEFITVVIVVCSTVLDIIVVVGLGVVVDTGTVVLEQEELSIIDLPTFVIPTL